MHKIIAKLFIDSDSANAIKWCNDDIDVPWNVLELLVEFYLQCEEKMVGYFNHPQRPWLKCGG